jgi:hypothetical protein
VPYNVASLLAMNLPVMKPVSVLDFCLLSNSPYPP